MTKQNSRVLEHLRDHGSISQKQANELYGVTRLGARIYDLKELGYKITRELVTGFNRYGEKTRYAVYYLHEEKSPLFSK